ncbi:MAG TPA: homocitrate synthase family protein [Candidatus Methanoperedens sp.]|nr:homocitrate synthase family protein [Candidatus Methanoperedens sp.]HLB70913.1 homocitrate synthase family protein [Candidatus Methanoperedens sp.]
MSSYSRNNLMQFINSKPADIEICDVTLRDGEQTPGVVFSREEKIAIAEKLDSVGVDVIEAGFPVVSPAEAAIVKEISHLGLNARICCLARSVARDIDVALACDVDFVSVFIATSDLHLKYKYHKTFEEAESCALDVLDYAKDHGLTVRFAAEDATRTDIDLLKTIFKSAEVHGADYVSIADTVGILNPSTAFYLISEIKKTVKTKVCIHCHNDLGMAVANTLSGAEAGAFQLHTTVNGIGERCGNASLEELLVGLRVQYGIERYDVGQLMELSKLVEQYSGVPIPRIKPIVGANAFSHESGIHVAAVLEEPMTYELFAPEMVGGKREFIIGKHTGSKALKGVVEKMGYNLTHDKMCMLLDRVKKCSEAKKQVTCDRLSEFIKELE